MSVMRDGHTPLLAETVIVHNQALNIWDKEAPELKSAVKYDSDVQQSYHLQSIAFRRHRVRGYRLAPGNRIGNLVLLTLHPCIIL